jgi:hypothetical protein
MVIEVIVLTEILTQGVFMVFFVPVLSNRNLSSLVKIIDSFTIRGEFKSNGQESFDVFIPDS